MGVDTARGVWWDRATMTPATRTIYYIGGPLNGEQHPESPVDTRFVTCGKIVYTACPTDPDTFTPSGMTVAEAMRIMKQTHPSEDVQ